MNEADKAKVDAIIVEHLGVEPEKVTGGASLIDDLGADSLDVVELVMAFEETFEAEIPDDRAERLQLVDDCYSVIDVCIADRDARK